MPRCRAKRGRRDRERQGGVKNKEEGCWPCSTIGQLRRWLPHSISLGLDEGEGWQGCLGGFYAKELRESRPGREELEESVELVDWQKYLLNTDLEFLRNKP